MQEDDIVLQRFRKFRAIFASSNVPNEVLLDMVEHFITSTGDDVRTVESIPIMDGQMVLEGF